MTDEGALVGGRYQLSQRIGTGRGDYVWIATDTARYRTVSAKPRQLTPKVRYYVPTAVGLARRAMKFRHAGSVPIYDVVVEGDFAWLITEFVPGRTMTDFLTEHGTLAADHTAMLGSQLAEVLAAAHGRQLLHRAVEPDNVLLGDDGTVQITHWGIGILHADLAFLAPEVLDGSPPTALSDVFSLGCTLYYALEGELPFGAEGIRSGRSLTFGGGKDPADHAQQDMRMVLEHMLDTDPPVRPSMSGVATALAVIADGRRPSAEALAATGRPKPPPPEKPKAESDFDAAGADSGAASKQQRTDQHVWPSSPEDKDPGPEATQQLKAEQRPRETAVATASAPAPAQQQAPAGPKTEAARKPNVLLLLVIAVILAALVGIAFVELFLL